MSHDLTVTDPAGAGWTVRFLDRTEWRTFKSDEKFGARALRAEKLRKSWPDSPVFEGALAYFEGCVYHYQPRDKGKWLSGHKLMEIRL